MKTFFITVFFVVAPLFLLSQEKYKVVYDYVTENMSYYKLDKSYNITDTLNKPKIKRNSLVEIELKNVNPFAVDVVTDVKEEQIHHSGDGFNFSSLLGGINTFSSGNLNLNVDNLPADELFSKAGTSRGEDISRGFSDLNEKTTNVAALRTTIMSNLLNPNMNKEDIIENVISTAGIQEDARLPNPSENFYVYLTQLEKLVKEDQVDIVTDINAMSKQVDEKSNLEQTLSRGELIERNYLINDLQNLLNTLNKSTSKTVDDLNTIKSLYTMLEASDFNRTYDYELEADKVNIELKFVQSTFAEDANEGNNGNTLKTRNIKLFSKGGFKINTGVALTLNNFGSKSQDFYISDDGTIGSDMNDYFTPNLSTMINFYPYTGGSFNIGGSFGLSIPISSDRNVKGLNFLIGPSFHFGTNNRLSLSGGLAYGPVQKLTNGLKVGDSVNFSSIDNYTKDVYDFGYFFGISFSVFDIN